MTVAHGRGGPALGRTGAQRGMTLIELMVAMTIGLGITLAITGMLIVGENHRRTTTSVNDAEQTGAYAFYALDRAIRGAGSGFAISAAILPQKGILSCRLNVANMLPRATALPAPFASVAASNLGVAPVLIAKNKSQQGSDVLVVMNGSAASGGVPRQIAGSGSLTSLVLTNALGIAANDLVLLSQENTTGTDCLLEQVGSVSGSTLTLASAGKYYTKGTTTTLDTIASSNTTWVTPLGNANTNSLQMTLYGVGNNRTLYSYDLLQGTGDASQAIADGVAEMHALYGIDTDGNGTQDIWADPGTAPYDIASVMASQGTIQSIVSLRVALVLRSSYYDKRGDVSPQTLTLFQNLVGPKGSLQQTVTLSDTDRHYRYRVFEFTVPLRNLLILAGGP